MLRKASSTMSPRIGSRGCASRGNATSPTGSASSRTAVASRFSRSAPSSGRCFSPTRWWRPTTASSAERIAKPRVPAPVDQTNRRLVRRWLRRGRPRTPLEPQHGGRVDSLRAHALRCLKVHDRRLIRSTAIPIAASQSLARARTVSDRERVACPVSPTVSFGPVGIRAWR